jgi:Protein of unknown function (DUF3306)
MSKPENSEPENFLARWSSRKLAERERTARQDARAEQQPRDENSALENGALENSAVAETRQDGDTQDNRPFDPAQLPPLDSIGPDANIADFLRREVPPDLTRAALRRAWTSDPAIRDFVGLVENGWDFNDPSGMAGFGPISAEEVARLAGNVIDALPEAAPENHAEEVSTSEKNSQLASTNALPAGPIEATPKIAAPGRDIGHDAAHHASHDSSRDAGNDAAQQSGPANKTSNKS